MKYRSLGDTDLQVSVICLGSMTWGEQNSEREGHEQLDYALEQGVNFVDTAELYAIPPKAATYGRTEEIIGSWLKRSHKRDRIVLASKIAGPGEWIPHIRGGNSRFDRSNLRQALEGSLRRLGTDCIDLYQLHWPERGTNFFGQLGYTHRAGDFTPMEETLGVLAEMVQAGKIRHVGLSNETPWGAMRFMETAERLGLPRPVSIQNPYNLLNRSFEVGLAEVAQRERMGLLAYSPLGFGVLSGKYLEQEGPAGSVPRIRQVQQPPGPRSHRRVCGPGPPLRTATRSNGPGLCQQPGLSDQHHHRCHQHGTVTAEYRQCRCDVG